MKRPSRHLFVTATAWLARLVTMGLGILNIRLLTNRLGSDDYAAYVLIANLFPWFAMSDFGIGSALQNQLSRARAKGTADQPIVAAAIVVVLVTTTLVLLLAFAVATPAGEQYLGRFVADDAGRYVVLGAALLCGGTLAGFTQRIWYARQEGHIANAVIVAAAAITTFSLWRLGDQAPLTAALLAGLGPAALAGAISLILLAPRAAHVYRESLRTGVPRQLLRDGSRFWALGAMATLVLNLDYVVLSQFLSSHDALEYSISVRMFDLVTVFYGSLLLAYWPAAAEALALGRLSEVRRTALGYAGLALIGSLVAGVAFAVMRHLIVRLLAPNQTVELSLALIAALTGLTMLRLWTNTNALVLQALGRMRLLLFVTPAQAAVNIGLLLLLVPWLGTPGIPLAMALSYLTTAAWALPVYIRRLEREASVASVVLVPETGVQRE